MKKNVMIGIVIALIMIMPLTIFATAMEGETIECRDSLKISSEVKQQLGVDISEKIIKIYNLSIHRAFDKVNSIDELLKSEGLILSEYYAIQSTDGMLSYKSIDNDVAINLGDVPTNAYAMKALQGDNIVNRISSDIKAYEVYYLSGETTYSGTAIYYKTNKGDFVYYHHFAIGDGEYLFPIEDFCEYQHTICEERAKYADLDGGVDISNVWDLSIYDMTSDSFAPLSNVGNVDINQNDNKPDNNEVVNQGFENNSNLAKPSESPKPLNMILWIGIPCVVILMAVGMVFEVKRRKG